MNQIPVHSHALLGSTSNASSSRPHEQRRGPVTVAAVFPYGRMRRCSFGAAGGVVDGGKSSAYELPALFMYRLHHFAVWIIPSPT